MSQVLLQFNPLALHPHHRLQVCVHKFLSTVTIFAENPWRSHIHYTVVVQVSTSSGCPLLPSFFSMSHFPHHPLPLPIISTSHPPLHHQGNVVAKLNNSNQWSTSDIHSDVHSNSRSDTRSDTRINTHSLPVLCEHRVNIVCEVPCLNFFFSLTLWQSLPVACSPRNM